MSSRLSVILFLVVVVVVVVVVILFPLKKIGVYSVKLFLMYISRLNLRYYEKLKVTKWSLI